MSETTAPAAKAICLCHSEYTFQLVSGAGMHGRDHVLVNKVGEPYHEFDLQDGMKFDADMMLAFVEMDAE